MMPELMDNKPIKRNCPSLKDRILRMVSRHCLGARSGRTPSRMKTNANAIQKVFITGQEVSVSGFLRIA